MMTTYTLNENSFLQSRVDDQMPIFCWLASGIRLVGTLQAHDVEAIFIKPLEPRPNQGIMMIFKQQISSIMTTSNPQHTFNKTTLSAIAAQ